MNINKGFYGGIIIEYIIEVKNEITVNNHDFNFLFNAHSDYYESQINKINSNLINDMAKVLISQYRLKYYTAFNQLLKHESINREKYDLYNMKFFDVFLQKTKNQIRVFNEIDLKILNSIINLSNIFLKNAIRDNDFDLLLDSFYLLRDKLESNNFIFDESKSIKISNNCETNSFNKELPIIRRG